MIKAEKKAILTALEQVIEVRQGFEALVHYCHEQAIPFNIVSAGLDFIIEHVMLKKKLKELVTIHAIETRFTSKGIEPVFQEFRDRTSLDFKDDLVKHYKKHGYRVIYIGDGVSDQGAIKSADKVFTIKNSSLSSYCERAAIVFVEIDDFRDIIKEITK
jgi:2-hydroxy-3-keto-5-methylthiopentenyl-1-phosphate phosphatase